MTDPACKIAHLALGAAGARLPIADALRLEPSRYGWSPKVDGAGVYWSTDRAGKLSTLLHRSGRPVTPAEADGLYGQPVGLPDSSGYAELECHTEAGIRARETRGWAALHMIDCARYAGRSISSLTFEQRHAKMHRWQSLTECYEPELGRLDWWTDDDRGRAHDPATGQYVVARPRDLRRLPIIPVYRGPDAARRLWDQVEAGDLEGMVAVALAAPLGARGSKRKVKPVEDIGVTILSFDARAASVSWKGVQFVVSAVNKVLRTGDIWDCRIDGWFESSVTPKFARLVSRRDDLSPC